MELIINDQNITNDRNWRLDNLGCNTARFESNPVLLYQHDAERVIGRCYNLRVEGSQLLCSVEFDENDPLAQSVRSKLESGFLRGVSPGFWIEKMSFGDEYDTVSHWELMEVSIVTIPSNRGALKLYAQDGLPLDESSEAAQLQQLKATMNLNYMNENQPNPTPARLSAKAIEALGLSQDSSHDEQSLSVLAMSEELASCKAQLEAIRKTERDHVIELAVREGRLAEVHRDAFSQLYDTNPDLCKTILSATPPPTPLSAQLRTASASHADTRFAGTWDELDRLELLATLKREDPELFALKFREKFNKTFIESTKH